MVFRNIGRSLFKNVYWHEFASAKTNSACEEARQLTKSHFDSNSMEQIVEHIVSKYELAPLALDVSAKKENLVESSMRTTGYDGREYTAPTYKVGVHIPYEGSDELFGVNPSTSALHNFAAEVFGGTLSFSMEFPVPSNDAGSAADSIRQSIDREISMYETEVERVNKDLYGFNQNLHNAVEKTAQERFDNLNKLDSIKTALKIQVDTTATPSSLHKVSIAVKKIAPLSTQKDNPGAYISEEDYEHIIASLRNGGSSMETNRAAELQDEEGLRDMMLVVLGGAITTGVAGGELFHKKGKTDIAIPFENKATFVAECKLWKGGKYISEGIDQLLSYTTWRDAKTALVIFNKDNSNFSAIQGQIEGLFTERDDFVRAIKQREGEWRFVLTKPDDPGRHIDVHVLLFDLYAKPS